MRKAADLVFQKYHQDRDLITLLTDAIAMPFHFNHEVNRPRRQAAKKCETKWSDILLPISIQLVTAYFSSHSLLFLLLLSKPGVHMIIPIVRVVPKYVQKIETIM